MISLHTIIVFTANYDKLLAFYSNFFQKGPDLTEGQFAVWKVGHGIFGIGYHDGIKGDNATPERMMFNITTDDVQKEFERISALDARVITPPYQPSEGDQAWVATLADPDGNYLQITSPFTIE